MGLISVAVRSFQTTPSAAVASGDETVPVSAMPHSARGRPDRVELSGTGGAPKSAHANNAVSATDQSRTYGLNALTASSSAMPLTSGDITRMSLAEKVTTTARVAIVSAAKDARGAVGGFLKNPKNDAMLAGGAAVIAGAQLVPGVDVAIDVTLGVVGAAIYASAEPEHRENVAKALGKLKDYATEISGVSSQAGLTKASKGFADFLTIGGHEAAEALGVVTGAASAPSKFFGLAEKAKALGGIDGVMAAASKGLSALDDVTKSVGRGVERGLDAAGLGSQSAFAVPGGGTIRAQLHNANQNVLESRAAQTAASTRRDVAAHDTAGGHTTVSHVGKSDNWLRNRLQNDPRLSFASTFTSEADANRGQATAGKKYKSEIAEWLRKEPRGNATLKLSIDVGKPIGRVVKRGSHDAQTTTKAVLF